MPSTFLFSIAVDFPNSAVDTPKFAREITNDPAIVTALDGVTVNGIFNGVSDTPDGCRVDFVGVLGAPEEAALNALVAAHDGIPTPQAEPDHNRVQLADSAGGQAVGAGFADIVWGTQLELDTGYLHTVNQAPITIQYGGRYKITYHLTVEETVGGVATSFETRLMRDQGAGYAEVPDSRVSGFVTNITEGICTITLEGNVLDLGYGDLIKLQAERVSGTGTLATLANESEILIERVYDAV